MLYIFLKLLGSLALFMFGMKTMSEGLQKMAGNQLRKVLGAAARNRFTGLITGAFITAAIQSSTAATVMTVSFVNAGLLALSQAISVIMGANIGTTMTAWIMSAGFNYSMADLVWPLFILAIVFIYSKTSGKKSAGEFIFGLAFMFLGLGSLRDNAIAMDLGHQQGVIDFFTVTGSWGFASTLLFLVLGGVLTFCVQSSAAVMAITMILCTSGALPIYQGIALVMGENIGTTITSNIAALTGNVQSRRAAMAHLVFNVFGVLWVLCIFKPFINMVCGLVGYDPTSSSADPAQLSFVLAAFHTSFNVCNVIILIGFIKPIEKLVCRIIPQREEADEFRLRFISAGPLSTAELSIFEARKEINNYAERTLRMFDMLNDLMDTEKSADFAKVFARVEKYEQISDNMEIEIAKYLDGVSDGRLSSESKASIRDMLREISEIESIGDSCYHIARTLSHKHNGTEEFTDSQKANLQQMISLTRSSMENMIKVLEGHLSDYHVCFNIESEMDQLRQSLKVDNIRDVDNKLYSYQLGVHYMDIINECEKLGDYVVNVVESRMETKHNKGTQSSKQK